MAAGTAAAGAASLQALHGRCTGFLKVGLVLILTGFLPQAACQPANFSEIFVIVGTSFNLELTGPGLSAQDRVLIRDAGTRCPGEVGYGSNSFGGSDFAGLHTSSVALSHHVCHTPGFCEPSPVALGQGPAIGRGLRGWQMASFFPVQLRWRGAFRVCYCTAMPDGQVTGASATDATPCDDPSAEYKLVGVVYSMGIERSGDAPLATCIVGRDGKLLPGCSVTVKSKRGGLSAEDIALFLSGDPQQICGEGDAIGAALAPQVGNSHEWKFAAVEGLQVLTGPASQGASRNLKLCYCERSASADSSGVCSAGDWQFAGLVALVGFEGLDIGGSAPVDSTCYRNTTCRAGPATGFGLGRGDSVTVLPGDTCAGQFGFIAETHPSHVTDVDSAASRSSAMALLPPKSVAATGTAVVCYCAALFSGRTGCQTTSARMFPLLLSFVKLTGLYGWYATGCLPTSRNCPEVETHLNLEDMDTGERGRLFLLEKPREDIHQSLFEYSPCSWRMNPFGTKEAREAQMVPTLEMPQLLAPGTYSLCYCENEIGCPTSAQTAIAYMQHVGDLEVYGSVRSVQVLGSPGIGTIALEVEMRHDAPGFRCCAYEAPEHNEDACGDRGSTEDKELKSLVHANSKYTLVLAVPGPRSPARSGVFSVRCWAHGETGRCAGDNAPCAVPRDGLIVYLPAVPLDWQGPWRLASGDDIGAERLVGHAGLGAMLKAVSADADDASCVDEALESAVDGLPCIGEVCLRRPQARAAEPGKFLLCICEPLAAVGMQSCLAWHSLGLMSVFGPHRWPSPKLAVTMEPLALHVDGAGFTAEDGLKAVLAAEGHSPSCISNSSLKLAFRLNTSRQLDAQVAFPEAGTYAICWSAAAAAQGSGSAAGFRLGTVTASGDVIDCGVGPWVADAEGCGAPCGVGEQQWERAVTQPKSRYGRACPVLKELRLCEGPPCSKLGSWTMLPEAPEPGDVIEVWLADSYALPEHLTAVLVHRPIGRHILDVPGTGALSYAGACRPDIAAGASFARCVGTSEGEALQAKCNFEANSSMLSGKYTLCACLASPDDGHCLGYYPPLGDVTIGSDDCPGCKEAGLPMMALAGVPAVAMLCALCGLVVGWYIRKRRRLRASLVTKLESPTGKTAVAHIDTEDDGKSEDDREKDPGNEETAPASVQPEPEPQPPSSRTPTSVQPAAEEPCQAPDCEPPQKGEEHIDSLAPLMGRALPGMGDLEGDVYSQIDLGALPAATPTPIKTKPKIEAKPEPKEEPKPLRGNVRRSELLDKTSTLLKREVSPRFVKSEPQDVSEWGTFDEFLSSARERKQLTVDPEKRRTLRSSVMAGVLEEAQSDAEDEENGDDVDVSTSPGRGIRASIAAFESLPDAPGLSPRAVLEKDRDDEVAPETKATADAQPASDAETHAVARSAGCDAKSGSDEATEPVGEEVPRQEIGDDQASTCPVTPPRGNVAAASRSGTPLSAPRSPAAAQWTPWAAVEMPSPAVEKRSEQQTDKRLDLESKDMEQDDHEEKVVDKPKANRDAPEAAKHQRDEAQPPEVPASYKSADVEDMTDMGTAGAGAQVTEKAKGQGDASGTEELESDSAGGADPSAGASSGGSVKAATVAEETQEQSSPAVGTDAESSATSPKVVVKEKKEKKEKKDKAAKPSRLAPLDAGTKPLGAAGKLAPLQLKLGSRLAPLPPPAFPPPASAVQAVAGKSSSTIEPAGDESSAKSVASAEDKEPNGDWD
eukprot:TRINITY_DN12894_c0_g1_i1.p1 TRINITY_DN12894_c0_g1~~TRINITY_DN12894_c0_g1_i1.p1  ORF type:complete len:1730 (-),score=362.08 TRINITY_DN12894_c0_g1_i1:162-5351(-)